MAGWPQPGEQPRGSIYVSPDMFIHGSEFDSVFFLFKQKIIYCILMYIIYIYKYQKQFSNSCPQQYFKIASSCSATIQFL